MPMPPVRVITPMRTIRCLSKHGHAAAKTHKQFVVFQSMVMPLTASFVVFQDKVMLLQRLAIRCLSQSMVILLH